jgi:hypothetical protein
LSDRMAMLNAAWHEVLEIAEFCDYEK